MGGAGTSLVAGLRALRRWVNMGTPRFLGALQSRDKHTPLLVRPARAARNAEPLEGRWLLAATPAVAVGQVGGPLEASAVTAVAAALEQPRVIYTVPSNHTTLVPRDVAVSADASLPNGGIDPTTLTAAAVYLYRTSDGRRVDAVLNTSGGGDAIVLRPRSLLEPNTQYTFRVTGRLRDVAGAAFRTTQASFTTGTAVAAPNTGVRFEKVALPTTAGRQFTALAFGPDGALYAGTIEGRILRFGVNRGGTLGEPRVIDTLRRANGGDRNLIGMAFDPASTASNPILWVSHGAAGSLVLDESGRPPNTPDWSGKITRLSGPRLETARDRVVHLPRSVRDHVSGQLVFGPDRALYFCQPSNSSTGAPDVVWGNRPERLLTGAILRLDPARLGDAPLDAHTADSTPYDPFARGAPLTLYATGVRNAFELVWHSSGALYAAANGAAAGGATPGTPSPFAGPYSPRIDESTRGRYDGPQVRPIGTVDRPQPDVLLRVERGGYYGHPNPLRHEYVLNGGNPTAGPDPFEVAQYPAGTLPDRNWRPPVFDFGVHQAPAGTIEYRSGAFGGGLRGRLLVVRYSGGDDLVALALGPDGTVSDALTGLTGTGGFNNPVDVVEDRSTGNLYVTEFDGARITLLRPTAAAAFNKPRLVFDGVRGAGAQATQRVTLVNTGAVPLTVPARGVTLSGTHAGQFRLISPPSSSFRLAPGEKLDVSVAFAPSSAGPKFASVTVRTTTPELPTVSVPLAGLGKVGLYGENEPSLQWVLDTWRLPVRVGDRDPSTNVIESSSTTPSDEVPLPVLRKAGPGSVSVEPLAVYSGQQDPDFRFGYHRPGDSGRRTFVFDVATPTDQTLNLAVGSGSTRFDPGDAPFALYTQWPGEGNRLVSSEPALNTWERSADARRKWRFYPLRDEGGALVRNAYVAAVEEAFNGDHQDAVFVIRNVQPVNAAPAGALPPPFLARDVGAASVPGSATYAGGAFTVRSAGADIWGTADSFRFVYRTMAGDGTIVARLTGITATHESAKAGLMMREGLAANARHVSVLVTPGFGALLQRRDATGGASASRGSRPAAPPRWLKLERRGNTFSGYVSSDRQAWSLVASSTVAMRTDLLVGLAVSSHDPAKTNTATFDQVEVTD